MSDWYEHVSASIGLRERDFQDLPTSTVLVPDDYAPPIRNGGLAAVSLAAGGAGFRSQVQLIASGAGRTGQLVEVLDVWFTSATANTDFDILRPDAALAGFTDMPIRSCDLRAGRGNLRIETKNNAAADAATSIIGQVIRSATAEVYIGPFPIRALLEVGTVNNAIVIRPTADNVAMRIIASYRDLDKRRL